MPLMVGSTGSMFPPAYRLVLVIVGAVGAKAVADATVKAMMAAEILMVLLGFVDIRLLP